MADSPARRSRLPLILLALLLVPAALFALWTWAALSYSYSTGQRVGYSQKLSSKGWLCKTWEGELALSNVPGQAPELFRYSVRDDAVARQIQALEGARVALTYEQHKGVPTSCFGETEYFATGARRADAGAPPASGTPSVVAPGAVPPAAGAPGAAGGPAAAPPAAAVPAAPAPPGTPSPPPPR